MSSAPPSSYVTERVRSKHTQTHRYTPTGHPAHSSDVIRDVSKDPQSIPEGKLDVNEDTSRVRLGVSAGASEAASSMRMFVHVGGWMCKPCLLFSFAEAADGSAVESFRSGP